MNTRLSWFITLGVITSGCALETPPECSPDGATRCIDNVSVGMISTCVSGNWKTVPCTGNEMCASDTECKDPTACEPGTSKCSQTDSGGILIRCDAGGQWGASEPCAGKVACADDKSCREYTCTPGEQRCVNTAFGDVVVGSVTTCKADNTWSNAESCPQSSRCRDEKSCDDPEPNPPTCATTDEPCGNISGTEIGQILKCTDKGYVFEICPESASCTIDNKCGECTNGEPECGDGEDDGGVVTQCKNGKLTSVPCKDGYSCKSVDGTRECGECHNGDDKCMADAEGNYHEASCVGGVWNLSSVACEVCDWSESKCENDKSGRGELRKCINGRVIAESCSYPCADEKVCGKCNPSQPPSCKNDESANGTEVDCIKGELVPKVCENGNSCKPYPGYAMCGECHNGEQKCENSINYTCTNGEWISDNSKCSTCSENEKKCEIDKDGNAYVTICVNGKWSGSTTVPQRFKCSNNQCSDDGKDCKYSIALCTTGPDENDYMLFTESGKNIVYQCARGCTKSKNDCKCDIGDMRCIESKDGVALLYRCNAGDYMGHSYWGDGPNNDRTVLVCPGSGKCKADHTGCDTDLKQFCTYTDYLHKSGSTLSDAGGYVVTIDGNSASVLECANHYSCRTDNTCGNCQVNPFYYSSTCKDGFFTDCVSGQKIEETCASGECANQHVCSK